MKVWKGRTQISVRLNFALFTIDSEGYRGNRIDVHALNDVVDEKDDQTGICTNSMVINIFNN